MGSLMDQIRQMAATQAEEEARNPRPTPVIDPFTTWRVELKKLQRQDGFQSQGRLSRHTIERDLFAEHYTPAEALDVYKRLDSESYARIMELADRDDLQEEFQRLYDLAQRRGGEYKERQQRWEDYQRFCLAVANRLPFTWHPVGCDNPSQNVSGSTNGREHIVLNEPIEIGRIIRSIHAPLCKANTTNMWVDANAPTCKRCMELAIKIVLQRRNTQPQEQEHTPMTFKEAHDYLSGRGYYLRHVPNVDSSNWEIGDPGSSGFDIVPSQQIKQIAETIKRGEARS